MSAKPPPQLFDWGGWRWDVEAAQALVAAQPRPAVTIPVPNWAKFLGVMRVEPAHAAGADLAKPVLVVPFLGGYMIIDGWHRIWRADVEQVERLPAYVLTAAEEKRVRLLTGGGA